MNTDHHMARMSTPPTHAVAFHIGTETVVCTCGDYFTVTPWVFGQATMSGVSLWAAHLRDTTGIHLQDAYDAGWRDACDDHLQQKDDPHWPIGRRHRTHYPHPSDDMTEHAEMTT